MGEVYRATDTRLDRTVAIKVVTGDRPEWRQRFEREARAVSALNHPHICALYDIGEHGGVSFLVMEYLEGETLAARIGRGVVPADVTLQYAVEIAEALGAAHQKGITHRDLKPGNIMLTKGGVKLLDFGLARFDLGAADLPTMSAELTQEGTLVGTLPYMAPEQLEGRPVDSRTDMFAFGAVLYEMIAGRRAFEGKSAASVIAAIIGSEPPPLAAAELPSGLAAIARTCLAKDPDARWQNARDLARQLRALASHAADAPAARSTRCVWREWLAWGLAAAAVLVAFGLWSGRPPAEHRTAWTFVVSPPEGMRVGSIAVSEEGHLAFAGIPGAKGPIWIRSRGSLAARPVAGTAGAIYPFWSPDSRSLGFFADGKLKKVALGGTVVTLCDVTDPRGGSWNRDGVILFVPGSSDGVFRVGASGGTPAPVTRLEVSRGENSHRWPRFLPDGRHFLMFIRSSDGDNQGLYLASLDSTARKRLLAAASSVELVGGTLLFVRDGTLLSQRFDSDRLVISGEPEVVAEGVGIDGNTRGYFSTSSAGVVAWITGSSWTFQFVWMDRTGKHLGSLGPSLEWAGGGRLSPDGKLVATQALDPISRSGDVWLLDTARGLPARFTSHPAYDYRPIWSPDGARIAFTSNRNGTLDLWVKAATGSAPEKELLRSPARKVPLDWSPTGRFILFSSRETGRSVDLWLLPMAGDGRPQPFRQSDFDEVDGAFSPDGKWVAYASDDSGRLEVYVEAFPSGSGVRRRVSPDGGRNPHWRGDGRELFYRTMEGELVAVDVQKGDALEFGEPRSLFRIDLPAGYWEPYDVTADATRFLVLTPVEKSGASPVTVVTNWTGGSPRVD